MDGWVKLYRKSLDSKYGNNLELAGLFDRLLLMANFKEAFMADGTKINAGQFMTSKINLSMRFGISEMRMHRLLKKLESEGQIEVRSSTKNSIITIVNWSKYQQDDGQNAEQVRNERGTSAEQVRTNKKANKANKENNNTQGDCLDWIKAYQEITGNGDGMTKEAKKLALARTKEGFTLEDCKKVVGHKNEQWKDDEKMSKFIRPSTLFTSKFETYLDEARNRLDLSEAAKVQAFLSKHFSGAKLEEL